MCAKQEGLVWGASAIDQSKFPSSSVRVARAVVCDAHEVVYFSLLNSSLFMQFPPLACAWNLGPNFLKVLSPQIFNPLDLIASITSINCLYLDRSYDLYQKDSTTLFD